MYLCVVLDLFSRRVVGWSAQSRTFGDCLAVCLLAPLPTIKTDLEEPFANAILGVLIIFDHVKLGRLQHLPGRNDFFLTSFLSLRVISTCTRGMITA